MDIDFAVYAVERESCVSVTTGREPAVPHGVPEQVVPAPSQLPPAALHCDCVSEVQVAPRQHAPDGSIPA
jgi:hypothetical protein